MGGGQLQGLGPADGLPGAVLLDEGRQETVLGVEALVAEAVAVGDPGLVDGLVLAGMHPQHLIAAQVQMNIGAQTIVGGQAVGLGQLPGTGLETEGLGGEGPHRAEINDVARQLVGHGVLDVGADAHMLAPPRGSQFPQAGYLGAEADTAGAMDTAGHVGGDESTQILVPHHPLALGVTGQVLAIAHGHVLQLALPALVADGTIQGVIDEQELHGPLLSLQGQRGAGHDLETGAHGGGAGGDWLGEGPPVLFHLHQAHAAVGGDGQLLVIAEARDGDAFAVGDLDDHLPRGRLAGATIDLDCDLVRHCAISVGDRPIQAASTRLRPCSM